MDLMARLLRRYGYTVETAASMAEGLAAAKAAKFDLVIVDLGLPDGDGCDLMSTLFSRYGLEGVALTGHGMDADVERYRRAGFYHHFLKPIDMPRFIASVGQLLSGPAAHRHP